VERTAQISRDVSGGYRYVASIGTRHGDLTATGNLQVQVLAGGADLLESLPEADVAAGLHRLEMVEQYPDLYVTMRMESN